MMVLRPFRVDAWVVVPNHLHAIWTLPKGDADFSGRWLSIKRGFFCGGRWVQGAVGFAGCEGGAWDYEANVDTRISN